MAAPKLRFKEFDQIWDNLKYKDVLTIKYGKDHKLLNEGEFPVYGTGGVMRYADQYLHDGESILIGRKGTIDQPKYVNEKFWTVDTLFYTQIKDNSIPLFLYQHALQVNWLGLNEATGVPSLNTTSINNVDIALPSKEEQTKIATFLSAVDEKISQLSQKLHLLGQYKQGMMQKIFSQQIRFKAGDGSQFGAWESKKLNEIGQSFNGLVGKSKEDFGEGEAYITYKQIFDHRKINLNNINFVNISPNDTQNMVKKGDIFFTTSSETANEVAYCSVILDDFEFPLYLNSFCFGYRPTTSFNPYYLAFMLRSDGFRKKVTFLAQGISRFNISKTKVMDLEIFIPSLKEQTTIGNFFRQLDAAIASHQRKLEHMQTLKKGLLQQMFV